MILMVSMKELIVEKSQELFLQYGYSKVTMSEIAEVLEISKKTIYQYYQSKEDLLLASIDASAQNFSRKIAELEKEPSISFDQKVKKILSFTGLYSDRISILIQDLKRNYPEGYRYLLQIKKEIVLNHGLRIIYEGVERQLIRNDWKINLSLFIFLVSSEKALLNRHKEMLPTQLTELFPESHEGILSAIVEIIYHGIKQNETN